MSIFDKQEFRPIATIHDGKLLKRGITTINQGLNTIDMIIYPDHIKFFTSHEAMVYQFEFVIFDVKIFEDIKSPIIYRFHPKYLSNFVKQMGDNPVDLLTDDAYVGFQAVVDNREFDTSIRIMMIPEDYEILNFFPEDNPNVFDILFPINAKELANAVKYISINDLNVKFIISGNRLNLTEVDTMKMNSNACSIELDGTYPDMKTIIWGKVIHLMTKLPQFDDIIYINTQNNAPIRSHTLIKDDDDNILGRLMLIIAPRAE